MTELPGRRAIFTGAGAPVPPTPSSEEIAEIRNYEKTIAELKNQLDVMVRNNPVPMI